MMAAKTLRGDVIDNVDGSDGRDSKMVAMAMVIMMMMMADSAIKAGLTMKADRVPVRIDTDMDTDRQG